MTASSLVPHSVVAAAKDAPKPITVSELFYVISDKRLGVNNTLSSKRQLGNLLNKRWEGSRNFKKSYTKRNEVMWRCE